MNNYPHYIRGVVSNAEPSFTGEVTGDVEREFWSAAIVQWNDKVVLVRKKVWPEDWFRLPETPIRESENSEEAVKRTVQESLGLNVVNVKLVGRYSERPINRLTSAYYVRAMGGELTLSNEFASARLVSPDQIKPWPYSSGRALRDWLVREGYQPSKLTKGAIDA